MSNRTERALTDVSIPMAELDQHKQQYQAAMTLAIDVIAAILSQIESVKPEEMTNPMDERKFLLALDKKTREFDKLCTYAIHHAALAGKTALSILSALKEESNS